MIYVVTRREFWSASRTIPRFAATAALLGSAGALAIISATGGAPPVPLICIVIAAAFLRLMADTALYERRLDQQATQCSRSADLLTGPLSTWNSAQALAAMLGGVVLPVIMLELPQFAFAVGTQAVVLLVVAELIQRGLFFAAAVGPRMPGVSHP